MSRFFEQERSKDLHDLSGDHPLHVNQRIPDDIRNLGMIWSRLHNLEHLVKRDLSELSDSLSYVLTVLQLQI